MVLVATFKAQLIMSGQIRKFKSLEFHELDLNLASNQRKTMPD